MAAVVFVQAAAAFLFWGIMNFHCAIASAFTAIRQVAGTTVTYVRGNSAVQLSSVVGRTDFRADDVDEVIAEYRSKDFCFKTCEMVLNGQQITPQRGDLIREEVDGGIVNVYEALRPDGGEQVWRYMDHDGAMVRVHTKLREVQTGAVGS